MSGTVSYDCRLLSGLLPIPPDDSHHRVKFLFHVFYQLELDAAPLQVMFLSQRFVTNMAFIVMNKGVIAK